LNPKCWKTTWKKKIEIFFKFFESLKCKDLWFLTTQKKSNISLVSTNGITQVTPTYFFTTFVTTFEKIFLKYFWNILLKIQKNIYFKKKIHIILLNFMLKIWQKCQFQKIQINLQVFYYLKKNVIMFNECFCLFFIHWINFKLIHMFP